MNIDFNAYPLPKRYVRQGVECFLDPIREKLIPANPEEFVRQQMIAYLIEQCGVPKGKIEVEVPMCYFEKGARGRADIVVYGVDAEDRRQCPVLIVECKSPDVVIVDRHFDQVHDYDYYLNADTVVVTNGDEIYIETYDWDKERYLPLKCIPAYEQMLTKNGLVYEEETDKPWRRPDFDQLKSPEVIAEFKSFGNFGDDTDPRLYPFIMNLAGFFYDESWQMKPQVLNGVNIVEDGGQRFTSFSNSGGNLPGYYRYFIVQDDNGNNQIISLGVIGLERLGMDHPRCPGQRGNTHIVAAIDDYDKSEWLLQVCIDKHIHIRSEKEYVIRHDCGLTCSKRIKNELVRQFIQTHAPELLDDRGWVYLGTLDNTHAITWDQPATQEFMGRLLKYALLRNAFKTIIRANRRK